MQVVMALSVVPSAIQLPSVHEFVRLLTRFRDDEINDDWTSGDDLHLSDVPRAYDGLHAHHVNDYHRDDSKNGGSLWHGFPLYDALRLKHSFSVSLNDTILNFIHARISLVSKEKLLSFMNMDFLRVSSRE